MTEHENDPIPGIMGQPPISLILTLRAMAARIEWDTTLLSDLGYPKLDEDESTAYTTICLNEAFHSLEEARYQLETAVKEREAHLRKEHQNGGA